MLLKITKTKIFYILISIFFIGCSESAPVNIAGMYDKYREENGAVYHYVMAGPDARWATGKIWENAIWDKNFRAHGFFFKASNDLGTVEHAAITACEEVVGRNECYVYVKGTKYVRLAERKKWLAKNPVILKLIEQEKSDYKKSYMEAQNRAKQAPTKKQPNYDASGALFDIANEAYKSTLPKRNNSITCNTILNPLGGITNCR
ncbi:hypothetical protein OAB70_00600 [bacterium]|nr:hypothetical protein [bacterium]